MSSSEIGSPVTGTVWKVERAVGDALEEGDVIMILESMKMEIPVQADAPGTLEAVHVDEGESVSEDQILCVVRA